MVATVEAAGFTAFDTGGATLLGTTKRTELLEVDMEREARVVRESFARRIARERAGALLSLCNELGLARTLDAVRATPDSVRQAVSGVLADPTYRRNAVRLRAEIAALPGPEHAVTLLETTRARGPAE
jgi:hypothetical protein